MSWFAMMCLAVVIAFVLGWVANTQAMLFLLARGRPCHYCWTEASSQSVLPRFRPLTQAPLSRKPRYSHGAFLRKGDFVGQVDTTYADLQAAVDSFVVSQDWLNAQESPPSTWNQVFYSVVNYTEGGAALFGEAEAELVVITDENQGKHA